MSAHSGNFNTAKFADLLVVAEMCVEVKTANACIRIDPAAPLK
jgi:hypothetical protein